MLSNCVDCVVDGRAESHETMALFRQAIAGEALPRQMDVKHPTERHEIMVPDRRTMLHKARKVVVLPAPLAPSNAVTPPCSTCKSMSVTAWIIPYQALTPLAANIAPIRRRSQDRRGSLRDCA